MDNAIIEMIRESKELAQEAARKVNEYADQVHGKSTENIAEVETALCDQDQASEERLGALEDALCDLDSAVSGGKEK